jgi:hypothetical protein
MAHNVHKRATLGNPTITGLVIRWDKDTIPSRIDPQFLPDAVNASSHERPATNVAGAPRRAPNIAAASWAAAAAVLRQKTDGSPRSGRRPSRGRAAVESRREALGASLGWWFPAGTAAFPRLGQASSADAGVAQDRRPQGRGHVGRLPRVPRARRHHSPGAQGQRARGRRLQALEKPRRRSSKSRRQQSHGANPSLARAASGRKSKAASAAVHCRGRQAFAMAAAPSRSPGRED